MKSMTRFALYALIGSVTISGLLGVMAILSGGGDLQNRILATTSTISVASLCALSCAALWERKKERFLPVSGIALTLLAALLVIIAVWANGHNDPYMRFMICVIAFAVASSHLSLLSLANLAGGFRWGLVSAYVGDYLLAALVAWITEVGRAPSAFELKTIAILSIAVASISILIPIFHRLSASAIREAALPLTAEVMCPCCGARRPCLPGEMQCAACGGVFSVKIFGKALKNTDVIE
jgi:hypothetical protein